MSPEEKGAVLDTILEEVAIVRKYWDPVGDLPIVCMLHELNELQLRRVRESA